MAIFLLTFSSRTAQDGLCGIAGLSRDPSMASHDHHRGCLGVHSVQSLLAGQVEGPWSAARRCGGHGVAHQGSGWTCSYSKEPKASETILVDSAAAGMHKLVSRCASAALARAPRLHNNSMRLLHQPQVQIDIWWLATPLSMPRPPACSPTSHTQQRYKQQARDRRRNQAAHEPLHTVPAVRREELSQDHRIEAIRGPPIGGFRRSSGTGRPCSVCWRQ